MVNQEQVFIYACIFGLFLGAFYDVFRIIRLVIDAQSKQFFILDVSYFFCCGVFTFLFSLAYNNGEVRFYILAGEAIGWCIYHLTLGELTVLCSSAIVSLIRMIEKGIKKYILMPVFRVCRRILLALKKLLKKCIKLPKKNKPKLKIHLKDNSEIVYNSDKRFDRSKSKVRPKKIKHDSGKGRLKK